jgi:allophanate hydrolase subunit 1
MLIALQYNPLTIFSNIVIQLTKPASPEEVFAFLIEKIRSQIIDFVPSSQSIIMKFDNRVSLYKSSQEALYSLLGTLETTYKYVITLDESQ